MLNSYEISLLKPLYKNDKCLLQYEKSIILKSCYQYKINPNEWIEYADGSHYLQLSDLLHHRNFHSVDGNYFNELQELYENKKTLEPFSNTIDEADHHQAILMNYCIHNNLVYTDLLKLKLEPSQELTYHDPSKSLDFLKENDIPLIKKAWQKELLDIRRKNNK